MFPKDPDLANERSVTHASACDQNFTELMIERDGRRYLVTNMPEDYCDAAHIVAHGKGDTVPPFVSFIFSCS